MEQTRRQRLVDGSHGVQSIKALRRGEKTQGSEEVKRFFFWEEKMHVLQKKKELLIMFDYLIAVVVLVGNKTFF